MGSATGRHRRPRQAPAIVVAAGVTGSAIAIPLLGAGGAQAADATTWDRVAECESGGMWSADLGNGYYGGLQFSQDTWNAYGGTEYASRADLASRSQQIAVAENVLDDKGPQAWPSCAVISGLALDGTLPGVDPGGEPSAEPSGTATETPSSDASDQAASKDDADAKSDAEPKGKAKDKGKAAGGTADTGDAAGSADASPSATPSSGTSGASGAAKGDAAKGDASTGGKHAAPPLPRAAPGRRWTRDASRAGTPRGATRRPVRAPRRRTPSARATTSGRSPTRRSSRVAGPLCTRRTRTNWAPTRTSSCPARA